MVVDGRHVLKLNFNFEVYLYYVRECRTSLTAVYFRCFQGYPSNTTRVVPEAGPVELDQDIITLWDPYSGMSRRLRPVALGASLRSRARLVAKYDIAHGIGYWVAYGLFVFKDTTEYADKRGMVTFLATGFCFPSAYSRTGLHHRNNG